MKKFFSVLGNLFLTILSIFTHILFTIFLLGTLFLGIVRLKTSASSIIKYFIQMGNKVEIPFLNNKDKLEEYENYVYYDINLINELKSYFETEDIYLEEDFINELLFDPITFNFLEKYVQETIDYAAGNIQEFSYDNEDYYTVAYHCFDRYEETTGKIVDHSVFDRNHGSDFEDFIIDVRDDLDEAREDSEISFIFDFLKIWTFILSLKFLFICIGACLVFALILFFLRKNFFAWLKSISIPSIICGALICLFYYSCSLLFANTSTIDSLVTFGATVVSFLKPFKITGFITLALGIGLAVVESVLSKKNEKIIEKTTI